MTEYSPIFCHFDRFAYYILVNHTKLTNETLCQVGVFNGFGQVAGFINPVLMAALTNVDETHTDYAQAYARGWRNFFLLNGGAAVVSILAVLGGFAMRRGEWKRHPSLERRDGDVKKGRDEETERERSRIYENRCDNLELN